MKFIIIASVSYVVAVLAFTGFLSFVMWRNAFRDLGYGCVIRNIVGGVAIIWIIYGIFRWGLTL
ncbi:hypothetical protein KY565_002610 [Salmonella enterica]|nr:hypothetical protein [Salmonella enterica]